MSITHETKIPLNADPIELDSPDQSIVASNIVDATITNMIARRSLHKQLIDFRHQEEVSPTENMTVDKNGLMREFPAVEKLRNITFPGSDELFPMSDLAKVIKMDESSPAVKYLAFNLMIENLSRHLANYIGLTLFSKDRGTAEDAAQIAIVNIVKGLDKLDVRNSYNFVGWVLKIARNSAFDVNRKIKETTFPTLPESGTYINLEQRGFGGGREDLEIMLDSLEGNQKIVFVYHFVLGLTTAEIADELGITETAAIGLAFRARKKAKASVRN